MKKARRRQTAFPSHGLAHSFVRSLPSRKRAQPPPLPRISHARALLRVSQSAARYSIETTYCLMSSSFCMLPSKRMAHMGSSNGKVTFWKRWAHKKLDSVQSNRSPSRGHQQLITSAAMGGKTGEGRKKGRVAAHFCH